MIKIKLIPFIIFIFYFHANAQESFSLEQAIQYGIEHNVEVKNANLGIQDAEAQIIERRAIGIPQVNGALKFDHYPQVPKQALPEAFTFAFRDSTGSLPPDFETEISFLLKNNFTASLTASSLLFDGSYMTGLKAAKLFKQYVQADLRSKEKAARDAVMEAYLPSLLITESLITLDKNIENLTTVLFETKEIFKAGFAEQLDVDRLELSLANLKSEKDKLERQKNVTLNFLKMAMNYPLEDEIKLDDDITTLLVEATDQELVDQIDVERRPEIEVANLGLELSTLNVELNERGRWPSLAAYGSYQYQYQGNNLSNGFWAPTFVLGAQLNVPIFDGMMTKAKVERAKIALETSENQKEQMVSFIKLEILNARTNYLNAKITVSDQENNLALAERIYNTTKIKYKEGVGSSLEVTQAEQALYQTQQNHIQAKYELLIAKIALEKAIK